MTNTAIFSTAFVKAVKAVMASRVDADEYYECVPAGDIATDLEPEWGTADALRPLVIALVNSGQVPGLAIRKGRDGGVFRIEDPATIRRRQIEAAAARMAQLEAEQASLAETLKGSKYEVKTSKASKAA